MHALPILRILATGAIVAVGALPVSGSAVRLAAVGNLGTSIPLQGPATLHLRSHGVFGGSTALQAGSAVRLHASATLWALGLPLQSVSTVRLYARAVLGQTDLQSASAVRLYARAVLGQTDLQSASAVRLHAAGTLTVATDLQSASAVHLHAAGTLANTLPVQADAAIHWHASAALTVVPVAPTSARLQVLNGQLIASVRADPVGLRLTWALDDDPPIAASWEWLNAHNTHPLILALSNFPMPNDGFTHRVTVNVWREIDGERSLNLSTALWLKPTTQPVLTPPKTVQATLLRNWMPQYRDLTRITWDWGEDEAGMCEVYARIRPIVVRNPRQVKNIPLGIYETGVQSIIAEGIGIKIFSELAQPERVFFTVSRYANGRSGPVLVSAPVYINANVIESTPEPENSDESNGTVTRLTYTDLLSFAHDNDNIMTTALAKIKDVVAKGGSVTIADLGEFRAYWVDAATRADPITGKATTTPPQRTARFVISPGFRLGTQRGLVLADADVEP